MFLFWCIKVSQIVWGMSSAQDPFYIVKEEIQDSVSFVLDLEQDMFLLLGR